jgi:dynein heavy chain
LLFHSRSGYRSAAIRSSLTYFVLDDMSRVDSMYQFSLDAYVDLFNMSIDNSRVGSLDVPVSKRCEDINSYHTLAVYKYTCRGLFEAHKLLFSLQLCLKIMETQGNVNQEEFNFFSLGAGLVDRLVQRKNPVWKLMFRALLSAFLIWAKYRATTGSRLLRGIT